MSNCPICESPFLDYSVSCNRCGYDFAKQHIVNDDKLRAYHAQLKKENWVEETKLKNRVTQVQIQRFGKSSTNPELGGWSIRKTAKELLRESVSTTSTDIKLAIALEKYPELLTCKSKAIARRRLDEIEKRVDLLNHKLNFDSEDDFQKYLYQNWHETEYDKDWEIIKNEQSYGKFDTKEIGEIDLLARHKTDNKWLVIELKKDQSSDETVGQLMRYMGWVKQNKAGQDGTVEGLIISASPDLELRYALVCTQNVQLKLYKRHSQKLILEDPSLAVLLPYLKKLPRDQQENFLREIENRASENPPT